jgi:CheY-like chemotaxis protein
MDTLVLKGKSILVVDDEVDLRDILASELIFFGAKVFEAESAIKAQQILLQYPIDLIISDIRMPGGTGVELLDFIKNRNASAPVLLITGFADITTEEALNKGAEALIYKPFILDEVVKMVVRHTSPLKERFQEVIPIEQTVEHSTGQISLGRGGLAMEIDTQGRQIDVGQGLEFEVESDQHKLKGQGVCRWLRIPEATTGKAIVGVEFMKLDEDSLLKLSQILDSASASLIPYIPSARI